MGSLCPELAADIGMERIRLCQYSALTGAVNPEASNLRKQIGESFYNLIPNFRSVDSTKRMVKQRSSRQ